MSNDGKRIMQSIIERMPNIENENVLKSIGLIVGDCAVDDNGKERADWIFHIVYQLVANAELEELKAIYYFSRGLLGERRCCCMKKHYVREIIKILRQIDDVERFIKIYTVAKTHLELEREKGGVK